MHLRPRTLQSARWARRLIRSSSNGVLISFCCSVTHEPTNGAPSTAFSVDLSLFSAHVAPGTSETDTDDEPVYYTYPCRCSGTYIVMRNQLEDGIEILSCDGCSERCRVDYQEEAEEYERGVLHREVAIMS